MSRVLAGFGQPQAAADAAREGLPFWIFWFLLCVILLLFVFIFLRDKDLRRRMSGFLSGARRKLLRLRLSAKIRKEVAKKEALWRELGRTGWNKDLGTEPAEPFRDRLTLIEEEIHLKQAKWQEVVTTIDGLVQKREETREKFRSMLQEEEAGRRPLIEEMDALRNKKKELMEAALEANENLEASTAEIKKLEQDLRPPQGSDELPGPDSAARIEKAGVLSSSLEKWAGELRDKILLLETEEAELDGKQEALQSRIDVFNDRIRKIADGNKEAGRKLDREIREAEANKARIQDGITERKKDMEPLFEKMGRALDETRPADGDLEVFYREIDGVDKAIRDLTEGIEKLR